MIEDFKKVIGFLFYINKDMQHLCNFSLYSLSVCFFCLKLSQTFWKEQLRTNHLSRSFSFFKEIRHFLDFFKDFHTVFLFINRISLVCDTGRFIFIFTCFYPTLYCFFGFSIDNMSGRGLNSSYTSILMQVFETRHWILSCFW